MPITVSTNQIKVKDEDSYLSVGLFKDLKFINPSGYVTPEIFGAIGDGVTDDTVAWKDAIASGQIILATKTYLCSEPLELNNSVFCFGTIINNVSDGVKIINKGEKTYWINVSASNEISGATRIGIEMKNSHHCNIRATIRNFYTGLELHGDSNGCINNVVEYLLTVNAMYSVYLFAENNGWVNENYFYNHRCLCYTNSFYVHSNYGVRLKTDSTSTHPTNSNHFHNCNYEGAYCGVHIMSGSYNTFENVRMETVTYNAIFDSGTFCNIVYSSYPHGTTTDNGSNVVINIVDIINKFSE